eukprot:2969397-Amphidinium_carterae.1
MEAWPLLQPTAEQWFRHVPVRRSLFRPRVIVSHPTNSTALSSAILVTSDNCLKHVLHYAPLVMLLVEFATSSIEGRNREFYLP